MVFKAFKEPWDAIPLALQWPARHCIVGPADYPSHIREYGNETKALHESCLEVKSSSWKM
jgi:hypothetical protein